MEIFVPILGLIFLPALMCVAPPNYAPASSKKCRVGSWWTTGRCGEKCYCEENQVVHCAVNPCLLVQRDQRGRVLVTETSGQARWRHVLFDSHNKDSKLYLPGYVRGLSENTPEDDLGTDSDKEDHTREEESISSMEYGDYEGDFVGLQERLRQRRLELHARSAIRQHWKRHGAQRKQQTRSNIHYSHDDPGN